MPISRFWMTCRPPPPSRKADLVEVNFLRMLKALSGSGVDESMICAWRSSRRTLAEDAALPRDLRAQYAIYGVMQRADRCRRLAEDRLFVGGTYADNESPRSYWDRADESDGYGGAIQSAEEVADAFRVRDEALAEIPFYARWLLLSRRQDAKLEKDLRDLAEKANAFRTDLDRTLQDYADMSAANYAWPKDRIAAKMEIERLKNGLKAEFEAECTRLDKRNEGSPKDEFRRLGVVLSVPLVSGQLRNRLRERYHEILVATGKAAAEENPEAKRGPAAGTMPLPDPRRRPRPAFRPAGRSIPRCSSWASRRPRGRTATPRRILRPRASRCAGS